MTKINIAKEDRLTSPTKGVSSTNENISFFLAGSYSNNQITVQFYYDPLDQNMV